MNAAKGVKPSPLVVRSKEKKQKKKYPKERKTQNNEGGKGTHCRQGKKEAGKRPWGANIKNKKGGSIDMEARRRRKGKNKKKRKTERGRGETRNQR